MTKRTPAQYDWTKALFNDRRLSKHFTSPRRSKIKTVTLHHMTIVAPGDGSGSTVALEGCYRTWQTRQASANYGVSGDQVWQYVSDNDAAWANASSSNHETLSIEHANSTGESGGWKVSDKTLETGARLVATLHRLYGLGRPSRKTVKMHRDYFATACPGPYMVKHLNDYIATAARFYDDAGSKPVTPPKPKPEPTKRPKWFSVLAWNLAVSNDHGRKTWTTRFPKIVKAISSHYSRDVLLFTEAWGKEHDAIARSLLKAAGYKVAVYFAGRAVVVRNAIKVGRTDTFTMRETGPAKDARHAAAAEIFPDGSAALAIVSHLEHRDGPAYDLVRVAQAQEVREWAEGLAKDWGLPLDRIVFYLDENSATWVSTKAFKGEWPDAADHADSYGAKSTSTFVGWTGRVNANGYRPDKVRVHKSRPMSRASTSPTFPELSDHLPVLATIDRIR